MKYNIPETVRQDICKYAEKNGIESVILFGSRARGTNTERSDIDIVVRGENFDDFYWDINENANSLLIFDLIDINRRNSQELMNEIERDGVLIYEKAR